MEGSALTSVGSLAAGQSRPPHIERPSRCERPSFTNDLTFASGSEACRTLGRFFHDFLLLTEYPIIANAVSSETTAPTITDHGR